MSGLHHQHREICTHPRPDYRISGSHSKLHQYGVTPACCQDKADLSRVSTDNEDGRANLSLNFGSPSGQDEFNVTCNSPYTFFLQKSADGALQDIGEPSAELRVTLSPNSLEELTWWDMEMSKWNGTTLLKREIDMTIDSDASLMGWGACCGTQTTRGA